jgi:diadenylate cyclase
MAFGSLESEELLSLTKLAELLGFPDEMNSLEKHVRPRGYCMLRRIPRLSRRQVESIVERYGSLQKVIDTSVDQLSTVEGIDTAKAKDVKEGLVRLRELNLLERYG